MRAYVWPPIFCGTRESDGRQSLGCGQSIDEHKAVYRCFDCDTPFHKDCLHRHCANTWAALRAEIDRLMSLSSTPPRTDRNDV